MKGTPPGMQAAEKQQFTAEEVKKEARNGQERQENTKYLKTEALKEDQEDFFCIHISILLDLVEPNCVLQTFLFPLTSF